MAIDLITFSGLASGIQWRDLVDQIITAESAPITRLQQQISRADARSKAWSDFRTRLQSVYDAASALETGLALKVFRTSIQGVPAGVASPISSVTANATASPGTHSVTVLANATAERLGSQVFSSRTTALGVAGEVRVNGVLVQIAATDTLDSIAQRFNAANGGASGSGVSASILATGANQFRLILSSTKTGAAGIDLVDGAAGVLGSLGFTDGTAAIKNATSSGALSDAFADATALLGAQLGFTTPAAGTVTIGGVSVALDLATMSLDDIASAINTAALGAGKAVTATVVADLTDASKRRLDIRGTTSFVDANHTLEALGVVEAGRGSIAHVIQGAALTDGNASTAASATTALANLWSNGAAGNAQVGDTLTISGTRGDGSAFSFTHTIAGGETVQNLLDRLNSNVDGLQVGSRTATATIDANGRITVTDDVGGASRLALSIVANNEGGGTLDAGAFAASTVGLARQIAAGRDAEVEIDGSYFRSASNTISDAIPGVTLNLDAPPASPLPLSIKVELDVDGAVKAVRGLVDAYNALADFVGSQLAAPAEGVNPLPLYGDGVLRSMRGTLRLAMNGTVGSDIAAGLTRLGDLGVQIQKDGRFTIDEAVLKSTLASDSGAVARLLGLHGASDNAALVYAFAGDATKAGTYAVHISQAATAAALTGAGFSGTYADDGTPDTMLVRDTSSNRTYAVQLNNGMTLDAIVSALNAEFATARAHQVAAGNALYADAVATPADESTTFASLHDGAGTGLGVANGDVLTISGTRPDGAAFLTNFQVSDSATQTLGDLRAAVQASVGADAIVSFDNGALTVTAKQTGSSPLTLAVSSDNAGGGSLSFGAFGVLTEGRGTAAITASNDSGQLRLTHAEFGSGFGFEVSYVGGGADATAALGFAAGTYTGIDVAGTIGGLPATGGGRTLTGGAGTAVAGLGISYTGSTVGAVGSITFSRGVAAQLRLMAEPMLGTEAGSIAAIRDRLGETTRRFTDRIDVLEARLDQRRDSLIRRFTAMEQAIARAQAQSEWLTTQLKQFEPKKN